MWGSVRKKHIIDEAGLDLHLGQHLRWILSRFDFDSTFGDEATNQHEFDEFQNEFDSCRWIMRNLLAEYLFITVAVGGGVARRCYD